jgi:hypothetical protein
MEELDLHGERHSEVDRLVENFVLMNKPPLTIITGHSQKMKDIVMAVLDRNELQYHEGDVLKMNYGVITVTSW